MTTKHDMDYAWLAGLIDGDGCFSIQVSRRQTNGRWSIRFYPQVCIGLKGPDAWLLEEIRKETGLGRCYISNKAKGHARASWQTTNVADALAITERILPHLRLKQRQAMRFFEACMIIDECKGRRVNKYAGERAYTLRDVWRIAEIATTLNEGRQTKRYRAYRGMDYWEPILIEIYS